MSAGVATIGVRHTFADRVAAGSAESVRAELSRLGGASEADPVLERQHACRLVEHSAGWARDAVAGTPLRLRDRVRNGDDAFVLYEDLSTALEREAWAPAEREVVLAARGVAQVALDLGRVPGTLHAGTERCDDDRRRGARAADAVLHDIAVAAAECLLAWRSACGGELLVEARAACSGAIAVSTADRGRVLAAIRDRVSDHPPAALERLAAALGAARRDPASTAAREALLDAVEALLAAVVGDALRRAADPASRVVAPSDERLSAMVFGRPQPQWAQRDDLAELIAVFNAGPLRRVQLIALGRPGLADQELWEHAVRDLVELAASLRAGGGG